MWPQLSDAIYIALRYYAAFMLLGYGFDRLMGAQFTILDSQLDQPLKHVSGFWLTWYYFGFSPIYSTVISLIQIGGAALLCIRRTALAGTLVLLPVMVNVVLIDAYVIRWHLSNSVPRNAFYVLVALLIIVGFHYKELIEVFWRRQNKPSPLLSRARWIPVGQCLLIFVMFAYTAHQANWTATGNEQLPTPLDGAWQVNGTNPADASLPRMIYFEYNRAFMCVFRLADGKLETHDFRVDTVSHTISIAKRWMARGPAIFQGNWTRDGNTMTLTGHWQGLPADPVTIKLTREVMPVKGHD